jgi:septal ring factor EnvC (AmiA/AmiB activator)
MRGALRLVSVAFVVGAVLTARGATPLTREQSARERRLDALQEEMKRVQGEMVGLELKEQGVLGDVARLDAEIALRGAELETVSLQLRDTEERLAISERELSTIRSDQAQRAPQLAARLREIYKRGPAGLLTRVVVPLGHSDNLDGFRYATYLSRRDAGQLAAWRDVSRRLGEQRTNLASERTRLAELRSESVRKDRALRAGRASRAALLERIRGDREQHANAFRELEGAARNLGRLVESFGEEPAQIVLDVRKFRGLLDWPAEGELTAGFGSVVHPRFKTEVPHPGFDIDAPKGQPFRSVFDGRVAYAAPLSGYGLTVVVDHGHGLVSIYAHAEVLLVAAGDGVTRGQVMGKVGDSGSLRGPYLYFELRDGGRPVDPAGWLRRR